METATSPKTKTDHAWRYPAKRGEHAMRNMDNNNIREKYNKFDQIQWRQPWAKPAIILEVASLTDKALLDLCKKYGMQTILWTHRTK